MKILIAGGGLQGVEAACLARRAGWEAALVDKRPEPLALKLAGSCFQMDLLEAADADIIAEFKPFDAIIPALEDKAVIARLARLGAQGLIPVVAIDPEAYETSSSKIASKKLFARLDLPAAQAWRPGAPGPFIAKPSELSGSRGVRFFQSSEALLAAIPDAISRSDDETGDLVIESALEGPQYSIEVTAKNGKARAWQVTRLEMDELSDCRLVEAPSDLNPELERRFAGMAVKIAAELRLTGLMDLEAILHQGDLILLEIDARLPSQTPLAVHCSTGVNLLVELVRCFADVRDHPEHPPGPVRAQENVVLEHVRSLKGVITKHGEHMMAAKGPLDLTGEFLGADFALVAGEPSDFVATLIKTRHLWP